MNHRRTGSSSDSHSRARLLAIPLLAAALLLCAASAAWASVTCDYDHEWHDYAVTVTFTGTGASAAVDHWVYQVPSTGDSAWHDTTVAKASSETFTPGNGAGQYFDGIWRVNFKAQDASSNDLESGWFYLKFDTYYPYTKAIGVTSTWRKPPVTITLQSTDEGSGLGGTWANLNAPTDDNAWMLLNNDKNVIVDQNGANTLYFQAFDNAVGLPDGNGDVPNWEPVKHVTVRVDNTKPTPTAYYNVTVRYGATAKLTYKVTEAYTPTCAVKIVIKKGTRVVRTISLGQQTRTTVHYAYTKASLARGSYTWNVYATDLAGNTQSKIAYKTLKIT